jgi:hypothetical protein
MKIRIEDPGNGLTAAIDGPTAIVQMLVAALPSGSPVAPARPRTRGTTSGTTATPRGAERLEQTRAALAADPAITAAAVAAKLGLTERHCRTLLKRCRNLELVV